MEISSLELAYEATCPAITRSLLKKIKCFYLFIGRWQMCPKTRTLSFSVLAYPTLTLMST